MATVREKIRKALDPSDRHEGAESDYSSDDSNGSLSSMLSQTAGISDTRKKELMREADEKSETASHRSKRSSVSKISNISRASLISKNGGNREDISAEDFHAMYNKFVESTKKFMKAERTIKELTVKRNELNAQIKEQEEIKNANDEVIKKYLEVKGREEYPLSNNAGSIAIVTKKKTESFTAKTIPKYITELLDAVYNEDTDFIETRLIPINFDKKITKAYPDVPWDKIPTDPIAYIDMFNENAKFAASIMTIYANIARYVEESQQVKHVNSTNDTSRSRKQRGGRNGDSDSESMTEMNDSMASNVEITVGRSAAANYYNSGHVQGVQGAQEVQGVQNTKNTQGVQGVQGVQGAKGVQNTKNTQGLQGVQNTKNVQINKVNNVIQNPQNLKQTNNMKSTNQSKQSNLENKSK